MSDEGMSDERLREIKQWLSDGDEVYPPAGVYAEELLGQIDRLLKLEAAVKRVLAQRADNICWRDVYTELAGLVGIDFCPELIEPPEHMLANCERFLESLRSRGPYTPVYVEQKK